MTTDTEQPIGDKSGSPLKLGEKAEAKPLQVRSFPNGLVIEELAMGKPDGKKATPGRKVILLFFDILSAYLYSFWHPQCIFSLVGKGLRGKLEVAGVGKRRVDGGFV